MCKLNENFVNLTVRCLSTACLKLTVQKDVYKRQVLWYLSVRFFGVGISYGEVQGSCSDASIVAKPGGSCTHEELEQGGCWHQFLTGPLKGLSKRFLLFWTEEFSLRGYCNVSKIALFYFSGFQYDCESFIFSANVNSITTDHVVRNSVETKQ